MSIPSTSSLEWLQENKKVMEKLKAKMGKAFPKELSALIKKHPEVENVTWIQASGGGFSMDPFAVNLKSGAKKKFEMKAFRLEVNRLLAPMPSSLLLELFQQSSQIIFTESGFTADYDEDSAYDSGDYGGAGRATPGKFELTDSPLGRAFEEFYALREQVGEAFKNQLLEYLSAHKDEVKALRWHQYSPYFNDGETCDFDANGMSLHFKGVAEFISEYDEPSKAQQKCIKEAETILNAVVPEVLHQLFGDHVEVTVRAGKFSKSPYEHD